MYLFILSIHTNFPTVTGGICDFAFAVMPMFFVLKLKRGLLERILVAILMSLGLCVTAITGFRLKLSVDLFSQTTSDTMQPLAPLIMWCRLEECALIAAACAPFLKAPIERLLKVLGYTPNFGNRVVTLNSISLQQSGFDSSVPFPLAEDSHWPHREADKANTDECSQLAIPHLTSMV
jgi:hypothetical protein